MLAQLPVVIKCSTATANEYRRLYVDGLDPNQAQVEISLGGRTQGSTNTNYVVPNAVDITGLTGAQTLIVGAEYVASDDSSTYPNSDGDYCDYNGSSRLSVAFVRISNVKIDIATCDGDTINAGASSEIHTSRICSGDIYTVSGTLAAQEQECVGYNYYYGLPCSEITGLTGVYGGYCGVVTPFASAMSTSGIKLKVPKADDIYGISAPNVTNGAPWGAGAFPPTPANTCTPTLPSSGTWAGYARVPSYGYNFLLVGVTGSYGHDAAPDSSTWNEVTNINWVTGSDTTGNLDFGCREYALADIAGGTGECFLPGSELARQHGQIFHTWASYGNMAPYVFRMRSGYHCVEDDCENYAGVDIFHSSGPYPWTKWYGCPIPTGCLQDGTGIYSIKIGTTVPHLKGRRRRGAAYSHTPSSSNRRRG